MAKIKKSWQEKLRESKDLPKIVQISPNWQGKWGSAKAGDKMIIPTPLEVDELMKQVPLGKLITSNEIRSSLTRKYQGNFVVP